MPKFPKRQKKIQKLLENPVTNRASYDHFTVIFFVGGNFWVCTANCGNNKSVPSYHLQKFFFKYSKTERTRLLFKQFLTVKKIPSRRKNKKKSQLAAYRVEPLNSLFKVIGNFFHKCGSIFKIWEHITM